MCCTDTLNILDVQSCLFYKPNVIFKSCGPLFVHNIDLKHLMKHYYSQNLGHDQMSILPDWDCNAGILQVINQVYSQCQENLHPNYLVNTLLCYFTLKAYKELPCSAQSCFQVLLLNATPTPSMHQQLYQSNPNTRLPLSLNTWQLQGCCFCLRLPTQL